MFNESNDERKAIAVLSGGPDSVSYAMIWKQRGYTIYPIIFDYGQKGQKEITAAKDLSIKLGFKETVVMPLSFMTELWTGTQLTDKKSEVRGRYEPSVVVPLRNGLFLLLASIYALKVGATIIAYGSHFDDITINKDTREPLYPDCSPAFSMSLEDALNLGHFPIYKKKFEIWSPARELMTKDELLRKGYDLMGDMIFETWSCYKGGNQQCGTCESCLNRRRAFRKVGIKDRTIYRES
ncbi:MAG: 7-cyano-7-deazaguanine synthase [Nitrososphaerota archaeon]|nr:7-cyano-7-deazaguanine synthase [Nitrososphaerota archaeon]MDG7047326.1 7-cyano-7-deazaguanine synthase [Nitrososphaerota archaeon]MDG7048029.1 7-cyano-7-deazaguanine synthase [Nitrososphaerota archaeon]